MDDPTIFKTAIPITPVDSPVEPEKSPPTTEKVPETETLPPSLRLATGRPPILVDMLALGDFYGQFDTKQLAEELDTFLNNEISRRQLKDDEETYRKIADELIRQAHLETINDPFVKLDKLAKFARIQIKLIDALNEHDALMTADPTTLTATKLKQYLKERHGIKQY